jgi:hypothetical protein
VTYIVAPFDPAPAFFKALISACGPPHSDVAPVPITAPFLTTTAPTLGLGNVKPFTLSASAQALDMKESSFPGRGIKERLSTIPDFNLLNNRRKVTF